MGYYSAVDYNARNQNTQQENNMPKKQKHFSVYKAVGNFIGAPFEIIVTIILLGLLLTMCVG